MFEVNTHTELLVLLRHQDYIREPLGVVNLADQLGSEKPSYLLTNCLALLDGGSTQVLFDWLGLGIGSESVLSQFPGNTWHVRRLPCKDVPVLTEEMDELGFLFLSE